MTVSTDKVLFTEREVAALVHGIHGMGPSVAAAIAHDYVNVVLDLRKRAAEGRLTPEETAILQGRTDD